MNLIEQINLLFDGFQNEMCRAWDGYNPYWRPNWKNEVETELNLELIHKLAMNRNQFAPDNNGAGELKESKIVGSFFLEANQ